MLFLFLEAFIIWVTFNKTDNKETLVIATHGFIKKVDKVPVNEIARATRLRDNYFNNKQKK